MSIDLITCTEYEMFNMITSINLNIEKERAESIKETLKRIIYVHISIFISKMNIKFRELNELM